MYSNEIKFSVLPFKAGYYWSNINHKMYWSDDIGNMVWEAESLPLKMLVLPFSETIEFVSKHPGKDKKSRSVIMRFITDRFPLKDFCPMSNWNGTIYIDLDLDKDPKIKKLSNEQNKLLYDTLDYALQNICCNNFTYIEHSNSGIGIHCIFYFDCEKTEESYNKYAKYLYNVFRYEIDDYIKDFSHIFTDIDCLKSTGQSEVFDSIYSRPYQKMYMTTKDYRFYNVTGDCSNIVVEIDENNQKTQQEIERGQFDVKFIKSKRKYNVDYNDRLYILTALKKYVGDKNKVRELWYPLCEQFTLYKEYTTQKFKNMLDKKWDSIKESAGKIEVLKKYGFKVDDKNLHIHLKENEYISDVVNDIINFCENGINLAIAPTGSGKTNVWIKLNDIYSQPLELPNHRPVLVIEPMNSIIESKYDETKFRIITGSKQFSTLNGYEMIITNYNHLLKYTINGLEVKQDVDEFFSQFELIIVDESHIMMKDTFRSDVLVPFMMTLNKIKNTKVIIQTATPLFEKSILDIKKTITIHKEEKCNTKVIYRQIEDDKFNISNIICLVNYYINNGKKVYIYWKNGSLQNMNSLKSIFPEAMIIYHKRDLGSEDMKSINEFHKVDKTNVIISSVYFGVGNDLNDDVDDAAVIVIGNNIWQEDIQAKGRWRNARNIEMCIILLPQDKQLIEASKNTSFDYGKRLDSIKWRLSNIYEDAYNRDKSVVISGQAFTIKNKEYIEYLAKMQVANEYSAQFYIKNKEFENLGYDVRTEIKPLLCNGDWVEQLKEYQKNLKDIRNKNFTDFLNGKYDWNEINKDSSLERCAKIIKKLQTKDLIKYCNLDKFVKSKILRYETFLRFYSNTTMDRNDYAELFSVLWVREQLNSVHDITYKKLGNIDITNKDYIIICGYLMWLIYRNKNENTNLIQYYYYDKFLHIVTDMKEIEDDLINRIFVKNSYNEEYNQFYKDFFNTAEELNDKIVTKDNLFEEITKLDIDTEYLSKELTHVLEYYNTHGSKQAGAKKGGKVAKKIKDIETGIVYDSCVECAKAINHNISYISKHKDRFVKV